MCIFLDQELERTTGSWHNAHSIWDSIMTLYSLMTRCEWWMHIALWRNSTTQKSLRPLMGQITSWWDFFKVGILSLFCFSASIEVLCSLYKHMYLCYVFCFDTENQVELKNFATDSRFENPKMAKLESTLLGQFGPDVQSRGILFSRTRRSTHCLLDWVQKKRTLQKAGIKAAILTGAGNGITYMTQVCLWKIQSNKKLFPLFSNFSKMYF